MMFKKLLFIATSDADSIRAAVNAWIWAKPGRTNVSRRRLTCVPPDWILKRSQVLVWDGREKWREIVDACKARGIEVINVAGGEDAISKEGTQGTSETEGTGEKKLQASGVKRQAKRRKATVNS